MLQVGATGINIDTSEDNTTRYWREQKARDKLQIGEELNNGLMKIKSRLLQQTLGNKIQFGTSGRLPLGGE
jgi:dimeric dUTPase (all-alpha-NTP-PPase superfamily)